MQQIDRAIVVYDNVDYNQSVRHQTLRDPMKHISATSKILCLKMACGGLCCNRKSHSLFAIFMVEKATA